MVLEAPRKLAPPTLCIVITGQSLSQAREQVLKAKELADVLEFRLDQFEFDQPEAVRQLMEAAGIPVIFTLRNRRQGGEYSGDEQACFEKISELARLKPAYFDLEYDAEDRFYEKISEISPETEIICSYHNFQETPGELQELFDVMKQKQAAIYKIAVMAGASIDVMRMMRFMRENQKKGCRLIGVCMGETGIASRILGGIYGSCFQYATLSDSLKTAPGQLTAEELSGRYRYFNHTKETSVLGLIGDPIGQSPSHKSHNKVMDLLGLDAVFVKFKVSSGELENFIDLARKLDMKGFAVTLPHKERVISFLTQPSEDAEKIGAINTLKLEGKELLGINTDGRGALNAIEKHQKVKGKTIVILGAGGAAKAVAYEAYKRGAKLIILNRTLEKAEALSKKFKGKAASLHAFAEIAKQGYDILINCTSLGMYPDKPKVPVDCSFLLSKKLVMDAVPAKEDTPLISEARKRSCSIVSGYDMLRHQAVEQFHFWFDAPRSKIEAAFKEAFSDFS